MTSACFASRRRALARQIFTAIGLQAAPLALLGACTNEIIVEDGGGGSTSTTTETTTGTTTTVPPTECNAPLAPGALRRDYLCIEALACPSNDVALDQLNDMYGFDCGGDDFCGCWEGPVDVPCGPDEVVPETCCYHVDIARQEVCEGRPFTVAGSARVAANTRRDDWRTAPELAPDLRDLDAATRAALAEAWAHDGAFEHASVASFARFVLELLAVGAPADLVRDAQAALADEIRHAEICYGMASAYRGEAIGPGALDISGALGRSDLESIAVATAVEGCINETLATLVAHAAAADASDPAARAALDAIAEDESRHAALAWRFVAWACARDASAKRAVARAFEHASVSSEDPCWDASIDAPKMRAHGQLDAATRRQVTALGFCEVVLPAARALLGDAMPLPAPVSRALA